MSSSEMKPSATAEAPKPTNDQPTKLKVRAQGANMSSTLRELIDAAKAAGINARIYRGQLNFGRRRGDLYIIADNESTLNATKEFLQKWVDEHPPKPRAQSTPSTQEKAENGASASGTQETEAATSAEGAEAKKEAESTELTKPNLITYVDLPFTPRNSRKQSKKRSNKRGQSETAESETKQNGEASATTEKTETSGPAEGKTENSTSESKSSTPESNQTGGAQSAARKSNRNRKNKKTRNSAEKNSKSSASSASLSTAENGEETAKDAETPTKGGEGTKAANGGHRQQRKHTPVMRVSQPDTVYVQLPVEATMEELRALLPDLPSVEISMGTLPSRKKRANGKKITLPEIATATITVGDEHRQKAIDVLKGKELHGKTLKPRPAYRRVLLEEHEEHHADEEARIQQETPESEHVESKE